MLKLNRINDLINYQESKETKIDAILEEKCNKCTAKCCNFTSSFPFQIETKEQLDTVSWQILHDNISVFRKEDNWHLRIESPCEKLDKKTNKCTIYESKPDVCSNYPNGNKDLICESDIDPIDTFDEYYNDRDKFLESFKN